MLPAHAASAAEEEAWQLQQQSDDIYIYSKPIAGSEYLAIKASVIIDAPITRVTTLLGDGNGCAPWRSRCKSSEVIDLISEDERYVYLVLDMPWPVSDRDMVLHSTTTINEATRSATVNLVSASSRHPAAKHVRAESSGQFVLSVISETQVKFTYIMHTELGGNLPAGAVNSGLADGAYEDLSRLRRMAES